MPVLLRVLQVAHMLPPVILVLFARGSCHAARRLKHTDPLITYLPASLCSMSEPERSNFCMGVFLVALTVSFCEMAKTRACRASVEHRLRSQATQARNQLFYASVSFISSAIFFPLRTQALESFQIIRGGHLSAASIIHIMLLYATNYFFLSWIFKSLSLALASRSMPFNAVAYPNAMYYKTVFFIITVMVVAVSVAVDPFLPALSYLLGRNPASYLTDVQVSVAGGQSAGAQREVFSRTGLAYWLNIYGMAQRAVFFFISFYFVASNTFDIEMLIRQSPVNGEDDNHNKRDVNHVD